MGSARLGPSIFACPAILHVASSNASLVLCVSACIDRPSFEFRHASD